MQISFSSMRQLLQSEATSGGLLAGIADDMIELEKDLESLLEDPSAASGGETAGESGGESAGSDSDPSGACTLIDLQTWQPWMFSLNM